ncbi:unnamed protein product [Didymodactylos carnosus]|uniref:Glucose-methanol-choline oxidoreductase C-terminal domain-containing protein n=1 Tax=Didymodactylos carnosus TaxID=1234261 RepID=A0A815F2U6_9BILA|nr:unnamed protein product [Didymodactylos carnosus]CAF4164063.1 unnamed protein product [Didymodactylos carnosus]
MIKVHSPNTLGTVDIQSANPLDMPLIQMHRFADGSDELDRVVQNVRFIRKLLLKSGTKFANYVVSEDLPGANVTTDADIKKFIKQYVWGHHVCCTSQMGKANNKKAVTNSKGQVFGVSHLRICDISIFPKDPGYFPFLPIYIASEKIAAEITKKWKK